MAYYRDQVHRSVPVLEKSRLAGTGRLADDLYLIAHHEITGRPYLSPRGVGIGVAGGLLAELMAAETPGFTLDRGCVLPVYRQDRRPVAHYGRPVEPVPGHVLDLILAESEPRPVRDWLVFLGKTSAAEVAGRLERAGYLIRPKNWLPWRTPRPVPVEADWAHCALLRARGATDPAKTLTPYAALLAGLTRACGLGFRLSDLASAPPRSDGETAQLLSRPLHELIACVQVTADSTVLSARR